NTLTPVNGAGPYVTTLVSGTLPAGLSATITPSTGVVAIAGTPTASGTTTVTYQVTDAHSQTANASLNFVIAEPLSLAGGGN
ncbi:hypothetical protein ABTE37_20300, partial [Acinetobacter baumannii]